MTNLETEIVALIDEGWARWKIAQDLGIGETRVRNVIKKLCQEYDCSMRDLPKAIAQKHKGE